MSVTYASAQTPVILAGIEGKPVNPSSVVGPIGSLRSDGYLTNTNVSTTLGTLSLQPASIESDPEVKMTTGSGLEIL